MPFPFIAPLKPEIKKKLENREIIGFNNHKLSPFIIISSGAVVTNNAENVLDSIKNSSYGDNAYKGCVITNHSALDMMYQTSETKLGYDLDGKIIKLPGETGRKISTPIIQSLEIDTDGGNNTLKSARVKIKIFSLKQLEFFDLFFLRPSMPVVLEYGWNTDIISKTNIDTHLLSKKTHAEFVTQVVSHFSDYKASKVNYLETLKSTDYNFDYMVGKVTDFTYSPTEDGTYDVDLEISAGNELQLWMPLKQDTKTTTPGTPVDKIKQFQSWLNKIYGDFNLPKVIAGYSEEVWGKEFFNWGMINSQEKDKTVSFSAYISFKFVLEILKLTQLYNANLDKLVYHYEDAARTKGKEIIPMNSHKLMCSTSENLIIPNAIPAFKRNPEKGKENELVLDVNGSLTNCDVNGKTFHITSETIYDSIGNAYKLENANNAKYGNLLNVFLNYDSVVSAYNESYTQADFINNVLAIVNDNTFGLCKLELMSQTDDPTNSAKSLSIIDYNLIALKPPQQEVNNSYRFKIGPNSILKEFSFNMELSTLAQAQAMYQSQLNLNSIMQGDGFDTNNTAQLKTENYKLFDLSYAKNSDNYFSINEIEKEIVLASAAANKTKKDNAGVTTTNTNENKDTDKKPTDLAELIKNKSVKFKSTVNNKSVVKTYIFLDKGIIQSNIKKEETGSALTYLDVTLAIDGISGLSCGEYFQIDGIPEMYNRNGYFQITNTKQGIDENGWKTTIEAGYRIDIEKAYPKK
jgi:hypothetical protein